MSLAWYLWGALVGQTDPIEATAKAATVAGQAGHLLDKGQVEAVLGLLLLITLPMVGVVLLVVRNATDQAKATAKSQEAMLARFAEEMIHGRPAGPAQGDVASVGLAAVWEAVRQVQQLMTQQRDDLANEMREFRLALDRLDAGATQRGQDIETLRRDLQEAQRTATEANTLANQAITEVRVLRSEGCNLRALHDKETTGG